MPATRLSTHHVAKPWGRRTLWPGFDAPAPDGDPVGEAWFQTPPDHPTPELLIKYLFTGDRLSVQVHPDRAARARGYPAGKDEAWLILAADPGAVIAMGPKEPLSAASLRTAAIDGSIVDLLAWHPVKAGDFIYSPAGTIHAIGAGLTIVEIQQNRDLTYRLYDYGRPRNLHVDDGIAVASLDPFQPVASPGDPHLLVDGPEFTVERWESGQHHVASNGQDCWLIPIEGRGAIDGAPVAAGQCWVISGEATVDLAPGAAALVAYSGSARR